MTKELTPEQIAEGWKPYSGNGEAPFKKSMYGPPFQIGRIHDGELCTTGVITEKLPDEIDWSDVMAYRVWAPALQGEAVAEGSCQSCDGTGWVDDQNWSPPFPDVWPPDEREPGNGKIQCGICLGTGTVEPDQSARIAELERKVERQKIELRDVRQERDDLAEEIDAVWDAFGTEGNKHALSPSEQISVKLREYDELENQIADLKARLVELEGNDRLAMEVIERQKEEVYQAERKSRELEVQLHVLKARLQKAVEVMKPFADALHIADVSGQPIGYHIGIEPCQRAAQFVRDGGE